MFLGLNAVKNAILGMPAMFQKVLICATMAWLVSEWVFW